MATAKDRVAEIIQANTAAGIATSFEFLRVCLPDVKSGTIGKSLHDLGVYDSKQHELTKHRPLERNYHGWYTWRHDLEERQYELPPEYAENVEYLKREWEEKLFESD